jgi:O-antigen/teichoic acid export membrane protein
MNQFSLQFPLLLIGFAYSADDAGNLSQAMRFSTVPAALLGVAVSSVLMAEIAERVRRGVTDNRLRYLRVSKALSPIAAGWTLVLLLIAPWALPALLGPGWASSGLYAAALAPSVGLGILVSPLTVVLPVYGRSRLQLVLDGLRLLLVCGLGFIGWQTGLGPLALVLAMSLGLAAVYAATWLAGLATVSTRSET